MNISLSFKEDHVHDCNDHYLPYTAQKSYHSFFFGEKYLKFEALYYLLLPNLVNS